MSATRAKRYWRHNHGLTVDYHCQRQRKITGTALHPEHIVTSMVDSDALWKDQFSQAISVDNDEHVKRLQFFAIEEPHHSVWQRVRGRQGTESWPDLLESLC